jgi:hypothetical protein
MSGPDGTAGSSRPLRSLASSGQAIVVQSAGVEALLRIEIDAAAVLASADAATAVRFYLLLEQVRGTHDATVLQVYLREPDPVRTSPNGALFLGSAALFGLRRATAAAPHSGMACVLDITAHEAVLRAVIGRAIAHPNVQFDLLVRPHPPLPPGTSIDIGRIGICIEALQP